MVICYIFYLFFEKFLVYELLKSCKEDYGYILVLLGKKYLISRIEGVEYLLIFFCVFF